MNRILVLGYFGYKTNKLDGQTVKTRDMRRLLEEQIEGYVDFYDTEDLKYHYWTIMHMWWKVARCRTLIYLPAHNNLKFIFPIIFCLSLIFRFNIRYFVVGGWLREFIIKLPIHRWMLSHITGIYVETCQLKNELEEYYHFNNVEIFSNFRFFDFEPIRLASSKLRVVFMARIHKMKGIDWIFHLADYIEQNGLSDKITITFYGPILEEDKEYFESNLHHYSFTKYRGILEPEGIYEELSQHDVMLLPTHYYTEGLPGTVVDAYISGIPVIVTEWKHSHEFIEDGVTGYIIPFKDGEMDLINNIIALEQNRDLLRTLQDNALRKRKEFLPPFIRLQ